MALELKYTNAEYLAAHAQFLENAKDDAETKGGPLSRYYLPTLLNFYNCKLTKPDMEVYRSDAVFEDLWLRGDGIAQVKSAMYSLRKMVRTGKLYDYTVQEKETSPGCGEVVMVGWHRYNFLGIIFDFKSLIVLQIENGKIIRHIDMWYQWPLVNRKTVSFPLFGRFAEKVRKLSMFVSHGLMWFAKEPLD